MNQYNIKIVDHITKDLKKLKDNVALERWESEHIIDIINEFHPIDSCLHQLSEKIINYDIEKIIESYVFNMLKTYISTGVRINKIEINIIKLNELKKTGIITKLLKFYSNVYMYILYKKFSIIDLILLADNISNIIPLATSTFILESIICKPKLYNWHVYFVFFGVICKKYRMYNCQAVFPIIYHDLYIYFSKKNKTYEANAIFRYNEYSDEYIVYFGDFAPTP